MISYPSTINELRKITKDNPDLTYYVILCDESVYIPGDQRSIDAPGHGYPSSTKNYLSFQVFDTRSEWMDTIKEMEKNKTQYYPCIIKQAKVEVVVTIAVT